MSWAPALVTVENLIDRLGPSVPRPHPHAPAISLRSLASPFASKGDGIVKASNVRTKIRDDVVLGRPQGFAPTACWSYNCVNDYLRFLGL